MKKKFPAALGYSGYFLIGFIQIMFAPLMPYMMDGFAISSAAAGAIFPARFSGILVGGIAGGLLSDKFGSKAAVFSGALLQSISFLMLALSHDWTFGLIAFCAAGIGTGFVNSSLNALIAGLNPGRRGGALNLLHGIYAAGCLVGPLAAGMSLSAGLGWRYIFYASSLLWGVFAVISLMFNYPVSEKKQSARTSAASAFSGSALILLLLFFVSFIYNSSATTLVGWINTYMKTLEFPVLFSSLMVSLFYAGLTLGRFACGKYSERIGYIKVIAICALGSLIFYPVALYTGQQWTIAAGVFLTGAFMSGLHPTALAYGASLFPEKAGAVTSLLSTSMSLGAISVPWITGIIAARSGFGAGFAIGTALLLFSLPVVFMLDQSDKKLKAARQKNET